MYLFAYRWYQHMSQQGILRLIIPGLFILLKGPVTNKPNWRLSWYNTCLDTLWEHFYASGLLNSGGGSCMGSITLTVAVLAPQHDEADPSKDYIWMCWPHLPLWQLQLSHRLCRRSTAPPHISPPLPAETPSQTTSNTQTSASTYHVCLLHVKDRTGG